ncbi:MAG: CDP-alcohol phosphatidyltransferase family protein [Acidimicrobiales bacterium]
MAEQGRSDEGTDRILTIPNVITLVRLSLLPVFLWLLFARDDRANAAWLLAALGTTDFLDGYIARRFHQVSDLGKVLDPVADRLLFFVGVGGILVDGSVPVWFAIAVLVREGLVAGATLGLAAMGARRIDVTWFGKAATFDLMIAFPLFLASESTLGWADAAETAAYVFGIPGLLLAWYSAALYVPMGRKALREGRQDAASGMGPPGVPSSP